METCNQYIPNNMACPAGEKKSLPSKFPGFNSIFIETNNIVNYLLKKERKVLINKIQAFSLKGSTCSCISPHKFITKVILRLQNCAGELFAEHMEPLNNYGAIFSQ